MDPVLGNDSQLLLSPDCQQNSLRACIQCLITSFTKWSLYLLLQIYASAILKELYCNYKCLIFSQSRKFTKSQCLELSRIIWCLEQINRWCNKSPADIWQILKKSTRKVCEKAHCHLSRKNVRRLLSAVVLVGQT